MPTFNLVLDKMSDKYFWGGEGQKHEIAEIIKNVIKGGTARGGDFIILKNGTVYEVSKYGHLLMDGSISPEDAYAYFTVLENVSSFFSHIYLHTWFSVSSINPYLMKCGFSYAEGHIYPATGLAYVAITSVDNEKQIVMIDIMDIDRVIKNTNFVKILAKVLGKRLITEIEIISSEYWEIYDQFISNKIFANHDFIEASSILRNYYSSGREEGQREEVNKIVVAYDTIFQPSRICYNKQTWEEMFCFSTGG